MYFLSCLSQTDTNCTHRVLNYSEEFGKTLNQNFKRFVFTFVNIFVKRESIGVQFCSFFYSLQIQLFIFMKAISTKMTAMHFIKEIIGMIWFGMNVYG